MQREAEQHISVLEIIGVLVALAPFQECIVGQRSGHVVQVSSGDLPQQAGRHGVSFFLLAQQILSWSELYLMELKVKYIHRK